MVYRVEHGRVSRGHDALVDEDAQLVIVDHRLHGERLRRVLDEVEAGLARRWDDAPHADRSPRLVGLTSHPTDAVG